MPTYIKDALKDPKGWLTQKDEFYKSCFFILSKFAEDQLKTGIDPHYTDHSIAHSFRVIKRMIEVIENIIKGENFGLNKFGDREFCLLFASALIHDCGMAYERVESLDIYPTLRSGSDAEKSAWRRENHHLIVEKLISRIADCRTGGTKKCIPAYFRMSFLELEDKDLDNTRDFLEELAWICKSHGEQLKKDDPEVGKPDDFVYKAALILRLADILDATHSRIRKTDFSKLSISDESLIHWYSHYFVERIDIDKGLITIRFYEPVTMEPYVDIAGFKAKLKEIISGRIWKEFELCYSNFKKSIRIRKPKSIFISKTLSIPMQKNLYEKFLTYQP